MGPVHAETLATRVFVVAKLQDCAISFGNTKSPYFTGGAIIQKLGEPPLGGS